MAKSNMDPSKPVKTPATLSQTTIRNPPFFYLHLALISSIDLQPSADKQLSPFDDVAARTHLTSALERFFGLTGSAIPIDILHRAGNEIWIRVPHQDGSAMLAALTTWIGEADGVQWRVKGSGTWLGGLGMGDGRKLWEV